MPLSIRDVYQDLGFHVNILAGKARPTRPHRFRVGQAVPVVVSYLTIRRLGELLELPVNEADNPLHRLRRSW